jgi:hypothetical protein
MLNLDRLSKFFTLTVLITFTLQGCALCPFGTSDTSKGGYRAIGKPSPNHSITKQMQLCRIQCVNEKAAACSTILDGSSNIKLIHQATGEQLSEKASLQARNRCEYAKNFPAFHEEQCASSSVDTCMKDNGYEYRYRDVTVCASMKML